MVKNQPKKQEVKTPPTVSKKRKSTGDDDLFKFDVRNEESLQKRVKGLSATKMVRPNLKRSILGDSPWKELPSTEPSPGKPVETTPIRSKKQESVRKLRFGSDALTSKEGNGEADADELESNNPKSKPNTSSRAINDQRTNGINTLAGQALQAPAISRGRTTEDQPMLESEPRLDSIQDTETAKAGSKEPKFQPLFESQPKLHSTKYEHKDTVEPVPSPAKKRDSRKGSLQALRRAKPASSETLEKKNQEAHIARAASAIRPGRHKRTKSQPSVMPESEEPNLASMQSGDNQQGAEIRPATKQERSNRDTPQISEFQPARNSDTKEAPETLASGKKERAAKSTSQPVSESKVVENDVKPPFAMNDKHTTRRSSLPISELENENVGKPTDKAQARRGRSSAKAPTKPTSENGGEDLEETAKEDDGKKKTPPVGASKSKQSVPYVTVVDEQSVGSPQKPPREESTVQSSVFPLTIGQETQTVLPNESPPKSQESPSKQHELTQESKDQSGYVNAKDPEDSEADPKPGNQKPFLPTSSANAKKEKKVVKEAAKVGDIDCFPAAVASAPSNQVADSEQSFISSEAIDILLSRRTAVRAADEQKRPSKTLGESQALIDELQYIVDGVVTSLKPGLKTLSTLQCMSMISLAKQCITLRSMMLIREHRLMDHVFDVLHTTLKYTKVGSALHENGNNDGFVAVYLLFYLLVKDRHNYPMVKASDLLAVAQSFAEMDSSLTTPCEAIKCSDKVVNAVKSVLRMEMSHMDEDIETNDEIRSVVEISASAERLFDQGFHGWALNLGVVTRILSFSPTARAAMQKTQVFKSLIKRLSVLLASAVPAKCLQAQRDALVICLHTLESSLYHAGNQSSLLLSHAMVLQPLVDRFGAEQSDEYVETGILKAVMNFTHCHVESSKKMVSLGMVEACMNKLASHTRQSRVMPYDTLVLCVSLLCSICEQAPDQAKSIFLSKCGEHTDESLLDVLLTLLLNEAVADKNKVLSIEDRVLFAYLGLLVGILMRISLVITELVQKRVSLNEMAALAEVLEEFLHFQREVGVNLAHIESMFTKCIDHMRATVLKEVGVHIEGK